MKHLKIYFAVLFFSILAGSECELKAQTNIKPKSTLFVGESLPSADLQITTLTSENGKYTFTQNLTTLLIINNENKRTFDLLKTNSLNKLIAETKVTEGMVTILTIENKNPGAFPEEYGPKEVLAKWGDGSKGGKDTKLIMQNDSNLVLYGVNGEVLWSSATPQSINY